MKKIIFLTAASLFFVSCASAPTPTTLSWKLDVPIISKTSTKPPSKELTKLGEVNEKFCSTDGELTTRMGMVDTVTKNAQSKAGAEFILNATYELDGINCLVLNGTAAK
jgi:hypothetical protein